VCVKCGKIDEFTDEVIEKHQHDVAEKYVIWNLDKTCLQMPKE
jgi:Fe2+ or Zn2+ uptake regulation protein